MSTLKDAKTMAKSLRNAMAERNVSLSHSECLEIVARQFGYADWNTLSAKLLSEDRQRDRSKNNHSTSPLGDNPDEQSLITESKPAVRTSEVEKKPGLDGTSQASSPMPWTTCSFCGKSRDKVRSLIGGCGDWEAARARGGPERSNAFICNECVMDCAELMTINSTGT